MEIGSGENPEPGYIHLDIQPTKHLEILGDVRSMPIPDNFVSQEIRAVHIMEHFCHPDYSSKEIRNKIGTTVEILQEAFRVLKPGGRFRMVTPDFEKICNASAYNKVPSAWLQRWSVGGHLNEYDVHHWLWTKSDAQRWFSEVGFVQCNDWNPVKNIMDVWKLNWTAPEQGKNSKWYRTEWFHWLFFEGTKP